MSDFFFFSSRRRHTRWNCDWSSDVCSSDLDPVAHHLIDGALVAVDRLHHVFEDGIEDLAGLLGVTIREELHRALQISKEHCDLLALAFQSGLGGKDLLGEV